MNVVWNLTERRFEAVFSSDFQGDLAAVKNVGFRTTGAPSWIWWTDKVTVLNKLRENRPASDLTIDTSALVIYKALNDQFEENQKIKKELARQRKLLKRDKLQEVELAVTEFGEIDWSKKWWIGKEDLPVIPPYEHKHSITSPPDLKCRICGSVIYFYELQNPPTCLWCEKQADEAVNEFFGVKCAD